MQPYAGLSVDLELKKNIEILSSITLFTTKIILF